MKGHVQLPPFENGYVLTLTKEDSSRTGFSDIIVLPLLSAEIYKRDEDTVKLELVALGENAPGVFYTRQNDVVKGISYNRRIFTHPTLRDTVEWGDMTGSGYQYTKEWIDNLDNEKEVTLKSYIIYENSRGGGENLKFSKITMKELAKARLHSVANLFAEADENWTRKQWQNWYENIIAYQEPKLKDCSSQNYNINNIYGNFDAKIMLYGNDPITNKVFAIQMLPYNVDQFKGRQIVVIDSSKYNKYDYYREGQTLTHNIRAFESQNKKLYFIDFYANWSSYEYDPAKDQYFYTQIRTIDLPKVADRKSFYTVRHTQTNDRLIYSIIGDEKSDACYIAIVKTQTGETLQVKSLKDLLAATPVKFEKSTEIVPLNYGLKSSDDFVFGIKQGNDYFLIKVDKELADVKLIKTTAEIRGATLFVNDNRIDVFKSEQSALHKISYDADLSALLNKQHTVIENWYSDEDGIVVSDGVNYRLFAPYRLSIYSGINLLTLNDKLETIKKQCVYQYLPLEEFEYDNMIHLEYATKQNEDWLLLFRRENNLRYAKVR
jgi:hypothetical protein